MDFGDGHVSEQQNPSHNYTIAGTYAVTLTVTDSNGNQSRDTTTITIVNQEPLVADAHGPYYCLTLQYVQFTGSATGGLLQYTWHWDFGNGITSDEQNPERRFYSTGSHIVTFTVTDSRGNQSSNVTTLDIHDSLFLDANGSYTGFVDELISFTGFASGGFPPYNWSWSFGDGQTLDGQNVNHSYTQTGEYTVTLTITDSKVTS